MLDRSILMVIVALFGFGFGTRSYVGAFVPTILVFAVILYLQATPTEDEVGAWSAIWVVVSAVGVLVYLAGVALGRRFRATSRTTRSFASPFARPS
jgi:hypothetical protein